jgi:hypothetical protein
MILTPTEHDMPRAREDVTELLIREAHQSSRRRRLRWIMTALVVIIAASAIFPLSRQYAGSLREPLSRVR